ncbi:MAG: hypothetical protein F6K07_32895 [Okeania sp. SIO1H5]|uniref:hypothetical protein n=1 Tax=Okeania sp. SIO1H5 TaxID=2607777 RepID=UPI0013BB1DA9|nr:hypothetical protein [Okeania sp. SIO1H5]NET23792.1 hypothetical protein [Okeania sp. SIO1H5]
MNGIGIEQKKGDPKALKGKLVAYVRVRSSSDSSGPLSAMIANGLLAVQANYVDQRSIKDFFREEFGVSLEKGIQEVIDQARQSGGLEGALDPEAVRERLESMKNAEFIPIPAKVAHFSSEMEILSQDADIYYLGAFEMANHAHLCVNSFPIMYQAYFREQENRLLEKEINTMLGVVEKKIVGDGKTIQNFEGDIKEHLLKDLIPKMIYNQQDETEYETALANFKAFMADFGYPEDMQAVINLVTADLGAQPEKLKRLELIVAKIEALQKENYEELERIKKELSQFDS